MLVFVYLLLFLAKLSTITGTYSYGIIRNASIEIPLDFIDNDGFSMEVSNCTDCLCRAFRDTRVILFTCAINDLTNSSESNDAEFVCQFFYFEPTRDAFRRPINGSNVYLMRNITFKEKDDCCNTTFLIEKLQQADYDTSFDTRPFRFLVFGDNETIVSTTVESGGRIVKFDRTTLNVTEESSNINNVMTVGYHKKKYYAGFGSDIHIYNTSLVDMNERLSTRTRAATTIRFLGDQYMIIGTDSGGFTIIEGQDGSFVPELTSSPGWRPNFQVHGIGVINGSAFYSSVLRNDLNPIILHYRDRNGAWLEQQVIGGSPGVTDLVVDNCQRIWTVIADSMGTKIFIYHSNSTRLGEININRSVFNLLILANYTLVMSHDSPGLGLSRLRPSLNCRRPH